MLVHFPENRIITFAPQKCNKEKDNKIKSESKTNLKVV